MAEMDEGVLEVATPSMGMPVSKHSHSSFIFGCLLVLFGVLALSAIAIAEAGWLRSVPWANALMVVNDGTMPEGAIPVRLREIPPPDEAAIQQIMLAIQSQQVTEEDVAEVVNEEMLDGADSVDTVDVVDKVKLPYTFQEHFVLLELSAELWNDLLGDGRLPVAGQPEVIAGDLCQQKQITLDGQSFEVVGHLKRGASAMNMAYLLPDDTRWDGHFSETTSAEVGWLHPDGLTQVETFLDAETMPETAYAVAGGRTRPLFYYLAIIALLLIAIGGSVAHTAFFTRMAEKDMGMVSPIFLACREWPRLLFGCHVFYFGVFFFAMLEGTENPVWGARIGEYLGQAFTDGSLSYIGDAYSSGNYLHAAAATWWNNYVMQTLLLTFGISLVPLGAGLLKTVFSFAMTGFVMAPMQVGSAGGYSYHSITMVLELEAYIVACFAVILWTVHVYRAVTSATPIQDLIAGARIMLGGVVLTGIMLGIAGIYEAVTLIVFSQN